MKYFVTAIFKISRAANEIRKNFQGKYMHKKHQQKKHQPNQRFFGAFFNIINNNFL
jgi:hypothetical protein